MKTLLTALIIVSATAAHAQSYEQRAATEKAAATLVQLDKAGMDAARAPTTSAAVAQPKAPTTSPSDPLPWDHPISLAAMAALGAVLFWAARRRRT